MGPESPVNLHVEDWLHDDVHDIVFYPRSFRELHQFKRFHASMIELEKQSLLTTKKLQELKSHHQ